jgi:FtsP/CotA-like multicopper oxidase with cupredoxin domain
VFQIAATLGFVLQAQLVAAAPRMPLPKPAPGLVAAVANQNHTPSGSQAARVLTLALDVVSARWKPEGEEDPEVPILAFAEPGKAPLVPGPFIRVRQGTEVRLTLHNRSDSALVIGGLRTRSDSSADTVRLAAGATTELRYRLDTPGTFFYWGALAGTGLFDRFWLDSQLNGAIVVDPPGGRTDDHVFVMSEWFYPYDDRSRPFESAMTINGKGFPHTERLTLPQGDSARFRVINTMSFPHPMHLHGFYYRIEQRGRNAIPASQQLLANTDLVSAGGTEMLAFVPTTPGNWIFHCHFAFHVDVDATLVGSPRDSTEMAAMAHAPPHDMGKHSMRGLVVALQVTPAPGYAPPDMANADNIKLVVQTQPGRLPGAVPAIGFMMQHGDTVPPPNRVSLPGPVLELVRGKPVRITVRNNLEEPTSVHWHGLEIESFPDGVPFWSGLGNHLYTEIAPRDSFVAEFVPPRAGTFPYHSHLNDRHQMISGMYGAIIVSDRPRDLKHDHLIVTGGGGAVVENGIESPYALVNGRRTPDALHLTAGETHRLRFVSIHPDWAITYTLRNDSTVARWRAVAKDGADLPAAVATVRPAFVVMGPGETSDFEFTPTTPGVWRIDVASLDPGWHIPLEVIVEAKAKNRIR